MPDQRFALGARVQVIPIEEYVENADALAQDVVNFCAPGIEAGNPPTGDLEALFDKACRYRTAKSVAENHREVGMLTELEAAELIAIQQAFAEAYKAYREKNLRASA